MAKNVQFDNVTYDLDDPTGLSNFLSATGGAGVSEEARQAAIDAAYDRAVGGGMSKAELQDFETLVGRLEKSKMKQADQTNRARQREVMTRGLASMMRNF